MTQALADATARVGRYLWMQFLVNAAFGAVCGTGLYLIGIPCAPLWGIVAGILRIIPSVGVFISILFPLSTPCAVFTPWPQPFLMLGLGEA